MLFRVRLEHYHDAKLEILADWRASCRRACGRDLFPNTPQASEARCQAPAAERRTGAARIDTADCHQSGRTPRESQTLLGRRRDRFHAGTGYGGTAPVTRPGTSIQTASECACR